MARTQFNNMEWDGHAWSGYDEATGQTIRVSARDMAAAQAELNAQVPHMHGFASADEMPWNDPAIERTYEIARIEAHSTYYWREE